MREHLRALPTQARAVVGAEIRMVQSHGLKDSGIYARQIKGKLWELRIDATRIFYVVVSGPELVLLHAYQKQGQKAPKGEIETALERMRQFLND